MPFVSSRELGWSVPVARTILATSVKASVGAITDYKVPGSLVAAITAIVAVPLWIIGLIQALNGGQTVAAAGMELIAAYLGGSVLGLVATTAVLVQLCLVSPYLTRLLNDLRELPVSSTMSTCIVAMVVFGPTAIAALILASLVFAFVVGMGGLPVGTVGALFSGAAWGLFFWALPTGILLTARRRPFREDFLVQSSGIVFLLVTWAGYLFPLGRLLLVGEGATEDPLPRWYPSNFWMRQAEELSPFQEASIVSVCTIVILLALTFVIRQSSDRIAEPLGRNRRATPSSARKLNSHRRRSPSAWVARIGAKNTPWLTDAVLFSSLSTACVLIATRMLGYEQDSGAQAMSISAAIIGCIPISKVPGSVFPYTEFSMSGVRRSIWTSGMLRLSVVRAAVLLVPGLVALSALTGSELVWFYVVGALFGVSSALTVGICLAPSASLPVGQVAMAVILVGLGMSVIIFYEYLVLVYVLGVAVMAVTLIALVRKDNRDRVVH